MNLVLNASEALGGSAGEIDVTTSRALVSRGDATRDLAAGEYVRLEISDTGRGMSSEVQGRISEPRFTTKRSGGGLGLSVVRRIVRHYGGRIEVQSSPGKGSHFDVLLPSAGGAAVEAGPVPQAVAAVVGETAATLLMVEDEDNLRIPIARLLRRRGYRVIEAADGPAAIEALEKHADSIDVMLLDLTVPGMRCSEVLAAAGRIRPDMWVVLTSAYSRQTASRELVLPNVKGFLRKPYEVNELTRVLAEVLAEAPTALTRTAGIW